MRGEQRRCQTKFVQATFPKKNIFFVAMALSLFSSARLRDLDDLSVCKNKISHIFSWAGLQTTYFTTNMNSPNDVQDSNANSNQKTYSIRRALKKTIVQLYSSNKLSCK